MIVFDEKSASVLVTLGYGTCGIGVSKTKAGEPCVVIDLNHEGGEFGKELGLAGPALAYHSVVITLPTEAQAQALRDAIFRFKQNDDGDWIDTSQPSE